MGLVMWHQNFNPFDEAVRVDEGKHTMNSAMARLIQPDVLVVGEEEHTRSLTEPTLVLCFVQQAAALAQMWNYCSSK